MRTIHTALPAFLALFVLAAPARAQVTPAAGYTPPDDTPSIKVGVTLFTDYTYQVKPEVTDADGNEVNLSGFNVARTYINVTGNISHLLAFRITPDITRETGVGSSLNGSLTLRLKYGYAQLNLDDWMPKGSWVRLGIQQTPWVDFEESVYRYRFQGPIFTDREGYLSSSDAGVSFHTAFPRNYGDVHVGVYNGETYSRPEPNDQKAIQIRGTFRPLPGSATLRGLRLSAFYDADSYVRDGGTQALHRRGHLRAQVRERRGRVRGHDGSDIRHQNGSGRQGVFGVDHPEVHPRRRGPAALRRPGAERGQRRPS